MAIVTGSGMSKTTGKVTSKNKAIVFKRGDAYAPEGSLGKAAGKNPAKPNQQPQAKAVQNEIPNSPFVPAQSNIIAPLVSLTGNTNTTPNLNSVGPLYREPADSGRVWQGNPVQRTIQPQPNNTPVVRLTSGAYTQPVYKNAETIIRNTGNKATQLEGGTSYLTPQNQLFAGPSPDVQIQQATAQSLDDIRFEQASFGISSFGQLPQNVPVDWASRWGLTPQQLSQMGYKLIGNLWMTDTTGFKNPAGSGGGGGGGTGSAGVSSRSGGGGGGGATGRSYASTSGYTSDQVFNWRLASG